MPALRDYIAERMTEEASAEARAVLAYIQSPNAGPVAPYFLERVDAFRNGYEGAMSR